MNALRQLSESVACWFEARARATADRDALAQMSDRELKDIGVDRASARWISAGAWMRDYP